MRRVVLAVLLAVLIGVSVPYLTNGVHFSKPEPTPPQPTEEDRFRDFLSKCTVKDGVIICPE